ncbi:single-stranded DNA-binding protein [uncultured Tessaracoccus sp.]|uniref:single-stranded DNA-binding protein n=1 Tax=uncultured Tessaracoccus sp. TaxID=905023 RepID=UPI0025F1F77D|nr:single-stranded DNA-binding protein [uncultured Tessaracoccus sp.]
MAGETYITVIGNLTAAPELRFTANGAPVANFTVASTPRNYDPQSGQWRDGDPMFLNCSVWRQYAENVTESLEKGTQVIVHGKLKSRSFQDREGNKRTVFEIDVDEVGPALRFATARVTKTTSRGGGGGGGQWQGNQGGGNDSWSSSNTADHNRGGDDPWGQAPQSDEPPF